jgi:hypothetical protein
MNETVLVAIVSSSGSVAVAITALLLNYRFLGSLERRIVVIESDLQQFYRQFGERQAGGVA